MRRSARTLVMAFACLLGLLGGCSTSYLHSGTGKIRDKIVRVARSAPPQVRKRWHPGLPQLGIDVYWVANSSDSSLVVRAKAQRIITYAVGLNANSIMLSFPFFTYGVTSDKVYASSLTPTPAHIAIFLDEAARSGIRVTLRPILNEDALVAQNRDAWRGSIEPANRAAWFRSYEALLEPYAVVAAEDHVKTFVIGTEFASLESDPRWAGLIHTFRSVFPGQLAYDENYVEFQEDDTKLPLRGFDVDAYPHFDLSDSATIGQLAGVWELWLGHHSLNVRRRTILSEVGITAVTGAYSDPGKWVGIQNDPVEPSIQSHWFSAVCAAVLRESIGGVYWWEVDFDANPASLTPVQDNKITFIGRPSQREIRSCFARLSG